MEELLNKIEAYGFECEGGSLAMCQDWMTLRALLKPDSRGQAREGWTVEQVKALNAANGEIFGADWPETFWQHAAQFVNAALAASPTPDEQRAQAAQEDVPLWKLAYEAFDDYWQEDCKGSEQEAWQGVVDAIRAALAGRPQDAVTQAARDVLAERRRQVEAEGWTPEHDDEHDGGQLAAAGAAYAAMAAGFGYLKSRELFPWCDNWWKPSDGRRNLVKAGALILAEIERLDRAALAGRQQL